MAKARSYKLLCPIARALDRIGDRWTLLILRDLHAGPMRFGELQKGLPGIAANLLTDRLNKLVADGLVTKEESYALTPLGVRTLNVLFELAVFGAAFEPEGEVVKPGNLRTVVTTLLAAARRAELGDMALRVGLVVDGEMMQLDVADGAVRASYGAHDAPDVVLTAGYEDLLAVSEGDLPMEAFVGTRAEMQVVTPGAEGAFAQMMGAVIAVLQGVD
ncbi:helix-turn-helix domain-containing protein [uncultured Shimia sp.]|uniref:winged helix-turn-helix transcriptional regulator n=1 Tax=uncultured Shimia sp. TaxID=573152 RepID=UPI00262F527B|nr:helix-turn-helix domain-containing protein [uncultured Shimia sp.]